MHRALIFFLALFVLSCSPRGEFMTLAQLSPEQVALAPGGGTTETIFVGTTRKRENGAFGFGRSDGASFLRYDISVPQDRKTGEVTWPASVRRADPTTDFLTLADRDYADAAAFRADLADAMAQRGQRDVVIYVHGFNNTLAESVYRVAQMHYDLKVEGVAVHYAWPSRGSALGYVYDRDSALFGRDGLEQLLQEVTKAGAKRVIIVAHSMGGALTMETLRQSSIRGDKMVMNSLGGVILISPDLDVDLFRAQARAMGGLPQPFVIFGSRKDTVLGISSRIAGKPERLGNLRDLTEIADLDLTYLDTTSFDQGAGHLNLGTSPALIQLLGGLANLDAAFRAEARARVGILPGVVLTVQNATAVILSPVEAVASGN